MCGRVVWKKWPPGKATNVAKLKIFIFVYTVYCQFRVCRNVETGLHSCEEICESFCKGTIRETKYIKQNVDKTKYA